MDILERVKEIIVEAGRLLLDLEKDKEVFVKESNDFGHDIVTSVDFAVEKFICEKLNSEFPEYQIFTEETNFSDVTSEYFWAIDPVDGTKNFSVGIPLVGISIGLLRDFVPILGAILNPYTQELYYAEAGKGAFRNGDRIHAGNVEKLSDAIVIIEGMEIHAKKRNYVSEFNRDALTMRNFGCATLDMAYLAEGKVQAYIDEDLKYHDIVAGTIILQEAGGKVTNVKNGPIFPRKPGFEDIDVVASNGILHDMLIDYIAKG